MKKKTKQEIQKELSEESWDDLEQLLLELKMSEANVEDIMEKYSDKIWDVAYTSGMMAEDGESHEKSCTQFDEHLCDALKEAYVKGSEETAERLSQQKWKMMYSARDDEVRKETLLKCEQSFQLSKAYAKVLKHRHNCEQWVPVCLDCFGGGLTKFTRNFLKEMKDD